MLTLKQLLFNLLSALCRPQRALTQRQLRFYAQNRGKLLLGSMQGGDGIQYDPLKGGSAVVWRTQRASYQHLLCEAASMGLSRCGREAKGGCKDSSGFLV